MKRYITRLMVLFTFVLVSQDAFCEFKKTKIAVLDFQIQGKGFETRDMGSIVAEWLITALVQVGRFDVIERMLLEKVLKEQNLGMSGIVDAESASKVGKVLGAKIVVSGSVIRLSDFTEVNARLIDVDTGSILAAEKVKSDSATRLEKLITMMADKIMKAFPLAGYVVQRSGSSVVIDLGKRAGVRPGMKFIVYKEGDIIKHPKTGEVLDIELVQTGDILVTKVKDKTATAKIINDAAGQNIEYGQMVKSTGGTEVVKPHSMTSGKKTSSKRSRKSSVKKKKPAVRSDRTAVRFLKRVHVIDSKIEHAIEEKAGGSPDWQSDVYSAFSDARALAKVKPRAPEVYLLFAKCFWANNRLRKAEKSLEKAFYFRHDYADAHIFRGKMYFAEARNAGNSKSSGWFSSLGGKDKYRSIAKSSFESALDIPDLNSTQKAEVHYRLGNIFSSLYDSPDEAKGHWSRAVSSDPHSTWAQLAREKLDALK